ncbi:MAG: hypothetical protein WCF48_12280, partial [Terriglobales bacterium]
AAVEGAAFAARVELVPFPKPARDGSVLHPLECPSRNRRKTELFPQRLELVPSPKPERSGFFCILWDSCHPQNRRETEAAAGSGQDSAA